MAAATVELLPTISSAMPASLRALGQRTQRAPPTAVQKAQQQSTRIASGAPKVCPRCRYVCSCKLTQLLECDNRAPSMPARTSGIICLQHGTTGISSPNRCSTYNFCDAKGHISCCKSYGSKSVYAYPESADVNWNPVSISQT